MRTIKFRIWADNKMDYSPETFTGWLNDNFIFDGYDEGKEPIVMQFTGLLDCKGKEIYEGDILQQKVQYRGIVEDKLFQVIWREGYGNFAYLGINQLDYEGGSVMISPCFEKEFVEILGNIYENSDLLTSH